MKRLRRRTIIALVLAGALAAGVLFFCFQLIGKGNDWVGFFGTRYYDSGAIYDRNGVLLYDGQTKSYAENQATRVSTLHLVGDQNFGTSLRSVLASRLTGYNLVTGTSLGSHDGPSPLMRPSTRRPTPPSTGARGWWRCMTTPRETCCVR